jgi:hypothetical protein
LQSTLPAEVGPTWGFKPLVLGEIHAAGDICRRADDDIGEEEWEIIEARAARRDLATDKEVEQVFARYWRA